MSRYRIRTSTSEEDREIQQLCNEAAGLVRRATRVARQIQSDRRSSRSKPARKVVANLTVLLNGLERVALIDSPYRVIASDEKSDREESSPIANERTS